MFDGFFMAGFECASHRRRRGGLRLDLLRATAHDTHALADYRRCVSLGLTTIRDGLRWHRIETSPGRYDWSSWLPMVEAAEKAGVQVVWDLHHYGAPDFHDLATDRFAPAFASFAAEAMRVHRAATGRVPTVCPSNEISFFAWGIGNGYFPVPTRMPAARAKRQLVRAATAAMRAMRDIEPACRFVCSEPLIHVAPRNHLKRERDRAQAYSDAQYEAVEMLLGRREPELGGGPDLLDRIGLNFYPHNQWYCQGATIPMGHHEYRALGDLLVGAYQRFGIPLFIAETGAEGSARPAWFHYVCDEVRAATARGARVDGVCLYPVTAYPGWDNSRHAEVGLFSTIQADGERRLYQPLADEIDRQRALFGEQARLPVLPR